MRRTQRRSAQRLRRPAIVDGARVGDAALQSGRDDHHTVFRMRITRAELAADLRARNIAPDLSNAVLRRLLKGRTLALEAQLRGRFIDVVVEALNAEEVLAPPIQTRP